MFEYFLLAGQIILALMIYLLLGVFGVAMLERDFAVSKAAYTASLQRTNPLFPRFPNK